MLSGMIAIPCVTAAEFLPSSNQRLASLADCRRVESAVARRDWEYPSVWQLGLREWTLLWMERKRGLEQWGVCVASEQYVWICRVMISAVLPLITSVWHGLVYLACPGRGGVSSIVCVAVSQMTVLTLPLLSCRVLRPPGGASNISFGTDETPPVRKNKMGSNIFLEPDDPHAHRRSNPPGTS